MTIKAKLTLPLICAIGSTPFPLKMNENYLYPAHWANGWFGNCRDQGQEKNSISTQKGDINEILYDFYGLSKKTGRFWKRGVDPQPTPNPVGNFKLQVHITFGNYSFMRMCIYKKL
jgi:hypothetical protein